MLDTGHIISHATAALDTIASLQGSDGGIIVASEVQELLTKILDILYNAVSKWDGNTAHILVYLFNLFPGSVVKSGLHSFSFFTQL